MTTAPDLGKGRWRWPVYASYGIASGMLFCFSAIMIQFLIWLFPNLDTRGMLLVSAIVIPEAFFSFWLVSRLPTAQRQIVWYRVTELVILLVLMKIFSELRFGPVSFWNNISLWPVQFPFNIFNLQYVLTILPVLGAWWAGNLFAADLSQLGTEEAVFQGDPEKNTPVRTLIFRRFLNLGILVVILGGIPAQSIFQLPLSQPSNASPFVIAYFVLGILLLSLTRYISLETSWWQAHLHIPVQIPRRYFAYSGLILVGLVVLVSALPTNYGLGLFDTLNSLFYLLYRFILAIFGLVVWLISIPIHLLIRNSPESQNSISEITPPIEDFPKAAASTFNWELFKSVLLWGSLIILVIIAVRQYIAYNQSLAEDLRRFHPLKWLIAAWKKFTTSIKKVNRSLGSLIQDGLKRLRNMGPGNVMLGEWDFINPRRLSPRQKVIFYYLALVRRARDAGMPRQEDQTPYEYARTLASNLTDEKTAVDAMTEAFIEARYSRHAIPVKTARQTESIWDAIRRVLVKVRRARQENGHER